MADTFNSTTTTTTPGYTNPANAPLGATTHATHVRETRSSTNWFAWLLGGAVIAVGIGALVYSGDDVAPGAAAPGNNVTIEAPTTAPAPAAETPVAPASPVAPEAPAATTPDAAVPEATAPAADAPVVADPVAPAPDAAAEPAPAAPSGN
ncbi:MAG: hypothetical protein MUC82_14515 [Cypionkella sp.]|jgi:hypothetical protein|nr:hypothetical protein [Cypionkella sp.]